MRPRAEMLPSEADGSTSPKDSDTSGCGPMMEDWDLINWSREDSGESLYNDQLSQTLHNEGDPTMDQYHEDDLSGSTSHVNSHTADGGTDQITATVQIETEHPEATFTSPRTDPEFTQLLEYLEGPEGLINSSYPQLIDDQVYQPQEWDENFLNEFPPNDICHTNWFDVANHGMPDESWRSSARSLPGEPETDVEVQGGEQEENSHLSVQALPRPTTENGELVDGTETTEVLAVWDKLAASDMLSMPFSSGPAVPSLMSPHQIDGQVAVAEPPTRRRQRSASPGDIRSLINASTFCFQLEFSDQNSVQPKKKARKQASTARKAQILDVRKKRACLRCHLQKLSCDGETPCSECLRVRGKVRVCNAVCERINIQDAIAFRIGNSKFQQETATVRPYPAWAKGTVKVMSLIRPPQAASRWPRGNNAPKLEILVREFIPSQTDVTTERWRSGQQEVILELPAYSAYNNQATMTALLTWVDDNFDNYAREMTSQSGDFLIGATFDEALRFACAHPDSMVKLALKLWIGVRMAQEFFCVTEDNDFEIPVVNDANSIHNGQCPVPPVLDHQLDVLMIQEMIKYKTEIFKKIEAVISARNSRSQWYEVYLTVFVLLANLQYVYKSQQRWWQMHFNTGKGNAIGEAYRSLSYKFMERYIYSASNLLSHFRYGLKGSIPFTMDWDKESTSKLGDMDKDAIKYVKYVSVNVRRRMPEFIENAKRVKDGEYEGDLFWISQLFVDEDP